MADFHIAGSSGLISVSGLGLKHRFIHLHQLRELAEHLIDMMTKDGYQDVVGWTTPIAVGDDNDGTHFEIRITRLKDYKREGEK